MSTGLRAPGVVKDVPIALELSREELQHEWRTLTAKRNKVWNRGQEFASEDDYRLRQVISQLNLYNQ